MIPARFKDVDVDQELTNGDNDKSKAGTLTGTVAALAATLGVKSGADLVIAAAAQLTLVQGKESFKRDELLKAMKSATSYYKQSYSNNLSATLRGLLTGGRLTEPATSTYALTAPELKTLRSNLSA